MPKNILIKFSDEDYAFILEAYKKEIITGDFLSRAEFIRSLIKEAILARKDDEKS